MPKGGGEGEAGAAPAAARRVLVLWNQTEEDIYERWQARGPVPLAWDPTRTVPDVGTVAEEMKALLRALARAGHEVACVNLEDDVDRLWAALRYYAPDVVFNLVEHFYDDETMDIDVVGVCELWGVPYTGARPHGLVLCQQKDVTKLILRDAGLPTAPFFVVRRPDAPIPPDEVHGLGYPLIVKPAREDASGGIERASVVLDRGALEARVRWVWEQFAQPALVEAYIDGRELHAAVLGNPDSGLEVLPLLEIAFEEPDPEAPFRPRILSYDAKWDPHSEDFYSLDTVCPATGLEPALVRSIEDLARAAYELLECRDYARIDLRVDSAGRPWVLEVNPNPDLSDGSAFILCALASGRSYGQVLSEIASLAAARWAHEAGEEGLPAGTPSDLLARRYAGADAVARTAPVRDRRRTGRRPRPAAGPEPDPSEPSA